MGYKIAQHPLARADGSTVLSDGLYTVIAGVNGPVEVQRRDEIPDEAAIEINIRPASGVGGPRERWLEGIIHAVVKSVLLVHLHPRTLVQITLQVVQEAQLETERSIADVSMIPLLVNAAFSALVDSGLPVSTTMSAILAVVRSDHKIVLLPEARDFKGCQSIHALAFDQKGGQLLEHSFGEFEMAVWEKVLESARAACLAAMASGTGDVIMDESAIGQTDNWLRAALEDHAKKLNSWRSAV